MGHTHAKIAFPTVRIAPLRSGRTAESLSVMAMTGSFLRNSLDDVPTYSEAQGYKPLPLGPIELELRPGAENAAERIRVIQ
jgi:hypothetical protein